MRKTLPILITLLLLPAMAIAQGVGWEPRYTMPDGGKIKEPLTFHVYIGPSKDQLKFKLSTQATEVYAPHISFGDWIAVEAEVEVDGIVYRSHRSDVFHLPEALGGDVKFRLIFEVPLNAK